MSLPTYQVSRVDKDRNEENLNLNLDMLKEKRQEAASRMIVYWNTMSQYYNKKVKERKFKVEDLVLKEITLATKNPTDGKLGPN